MKNKTCFNCKHFGESCPSKSCGEAKGYWEPKEMNINDLHNPRNIVAVLEYKSNRFVELGENQGFQELPKRVELWGMIDDLLMKIKGWNKTSVAMYTGAK